MERGRGGGLAAWGRRALERRGRETSGSLEQRKRPTMWEGRRPHRPEPERLTCPIGVRRSRQRMLPCTDLPAQSVADLFRHCLRQQPNGLPPGRPEHFRRGSPRRRCGGIAARYNHGEAVPRSGNGVSEQADSFRLLAYGEGATQQRSCVRRQDARIPRTLKASDALRIALTVFGAALCALEHLLP